MRPLRRRRRWSVLAVVLLLVGAVALTRGSDVPDHPPTGPVGVRGAWTEVLADEFDGTSLDRTTWQPDRGDQDGRDGRVPFNADLEDAWFSPSDVTVRGGLLELRVRAQPKHLGDRRYPYSSGMVQTAPDVLVRPGTYVEARIDVPRCDGCWPAFWLTPPDRWPPEIDAMEFFDSGRPSADQPSFNYIKPSGDKTGPTRYGTPGVDYRDGFHTYGLLWDGEKAVPYLDGVPHLEAAATRSMTRVPMLLVLNLSVRAGHHPPPGSRMRVDWVRAWTPRAG